MIAMRIKTKLTLGLVFLFVLILLFGILSIFYINRLSNDANVILKNNHESLVFCTKMLQAAEHFSDQPAAFEDFRQNLVKQEQNITETGEQDATLAVRKAFDRIIDNPHDSMDLSSLRLPIFDILSLNQQAILRKNRIAGNTSEDAKLWLTLLFSVLVLIVFTFVVNFPSVISKPVSVLSEAIKEIANKNYGKRIHIEQKDEFGALANTFNTMAEKLDAYENSNLAKITFEKKRIETIINQMRDGIIGFDENHNVLFLNAIAEKMLGMKEAEIVGKYAADIAIRNDLMRTLLKEEEGKELKIYAEGKESYFSKEMLDVKSGSDIIGQVIVLRNITPFHELNEAKTNFIATVSHELKTPIASIKMSTKLLRDERIGNLSEEQRELINSIEGDTGRLLKITSELLNMAQVETGQIQLKLQPSQSISIIEKATAAVLASAAQKHVAVVVKNMEAFSILADEEKTTWVLINLLANAIRFAPEHSEVLVDSKVIGKDLVVKVSDKGKGIAEKYLVKIFDRYFKVPGEEKSGTGLGLAICKEFIEAQQGSIGVNSKPGEGSEFYIRLPLV